MRAGKLSAGTRNEGIDISRFKDLAARVAATLPGGAVTGLAETLRATVGDAACYEASVRRDAAGLRAGRMMIEQPPGDLVSAIAAALDMELPAAAPRWIESAAAYEVPLIAGWDLRRGDDRTLKLYVNASDASQGKRAHLCAALLPGLHDVEEPAVLGMNVRADGAVETKIYRQSADAVGLAEGLGPRASRLAAEARAERADAGGVLSFDVAPDGRTSPRAFFIALREPPQDLWRCVRALPGFDAGEIEATLPFAPAPPRSVGVALDRDVWTLYCKPRDSFGAPQSLEPTTVFRDGDLEVGVFVEPNEGAPRAFRRTERSAVSIRVRQGRPIPHRLESLVDWFTERLRAAEAAGTRPRLTDPPAPWHVVDVDGRAS